MRDTLDPGQYVRSPLFGKPEKEPKTVTVQTLHEQVQFGSVIVSAQSCVTTKRDLRPSEKPTSIHANLKVNLGHTVSIEIPYVSAEFLRDLAGALLRFEKAVGQRLSKEDDSTVVVAWSKPLRGSKAAIPAEQPKVPTPEPDTIADMEKRLDLPVDSIRRWEATRKELSAEDATTMSRRVEDFLGFPAMTAAQQISLEGAVKLACIIAETIAKDTADAEAKKPDAEAKS